MKKYLKKAYQSLEEISQELYNSFKESQDEEIMKELQILQNVRMYFYKELDKDKLWKDIL